VQATPTENTGFEVRERWGKTTREYWGSNRRERLFRREGSMHAKDLDWEIVVMTECHT